MKKVYKRLIAMLMVFTLVIGMLPATALAAGSDSNLVFNKTATYDSEAGEGLVTLEAYAKGIVTSTPRSTPCDIVLVLDVSGSMKEEDFPVDGAEQIISYYPFYYYDNEDLYTTTTPILYKLDEDTYVEVTVEKAESESVTWSSPGSLKNKDLYNAYDDNDNLYAKIGEEYVKVEIERTGGKNDRHYAYTVNGVTVTSDGSNSQAPSNWTYFLKYTQNQTTYTYSYEAAGKKIIIKANTGRWPTETYYYQTITTATQSRLAALKEAVKGFIGSVNSNGDDHRISIVKFAGKESSYIGNDTYWDGGNEYNYSQIVCGLTEASSTTYLEGVIDSLNYGGATYANFGLELAATALEDSEEGRSKAVIMFTDGQPGKNGFDSGVAKEAISKAKTLKDDSVKVYTIAVFQSANNNTVADDFNKYMHYVSSNFPNATSLDDAGEEGSIGGGYYQVASEAADLSSIFDTITEDVGSAGVALDETGVMMDILSPSFTLPEGAVTSDIKVYTSGYLGGTSWDTPELLDATVTINGKDISVSGFDYSENYVATLNGVPRGSKLIVEVPVVVEAGSFGGYLPTNDGAEITDSEGEVLATAEDAYVEVPVGYSISDGSDTAAVGETVDVIALADFVKADGANNAGVTMTYTLYDAENAPLKTWTVSAGRAQSSTAGVWEVEYDTVGTYDYTLECVVTSTGDETNTTTETADISVEVEPITIVLTAASDSKQFDGSALTADDYTITTGAFLSGDGLESVTVVGSQRTPGSSANTITGHTLTEDTNPDNYDISYLPGTLTILDRDSKYEITVVANSDTVKYDGDEHSISGFETTEFTVGGNTYTVSGLSASASGTDADTYTAAVTGTAVVKDAENNVVTDQFIVKTENGQLTINKRSVTLTSADGEKEFDGVALVKNAQTDITVTGDGFAAGEGAVYDITGSQKYYGTSANSFTYELNGNTSADNYIIHTAEGSLNVTHRDTKYEITVVANSDTVKYDGDEHSVSGFVTSEFTVGGNTYTVSGLSASASGINAGEYTSAIEGTAVVKAADNTVVTEEFTVHTTNGKLTIGKRQVTLTSADGEKEFDNTPLLKNAQTDITVTGDGFADGEGAVYDITGSQTLVGSDKNRFTYTLNSNTLADNYDITPSFGTLTVTSRNTKYEITVVANSDSAKYDGGEHSVSGLVSTTFLVDGSTYTVEGLSASAKGTDADTYTAAVVGTPVVKNANNDVVTDQFTVKTESGKLTIDKRSIMMTSADGEQEYNGKALVKNEQTDVTVTGDGFVAGEGATYNITGTRTKPGHEENRFTYSLTGGAKEKNYDIETTFGDLYVKDRTNKFEITVVANSDTVKYDGDEHSVSGFETLDFYFDGVKFTVSGLSASVSGTDADTYTAAVTGTAVVKDAEGNVVTDQFIVKTEAGQLTIEKRNITLTSATDSKTYDGDPLTRNAQTDVAVAGDGFAQDESFIYTIIGVQKIPGSSDNTYTYAAAAGTDLDNYQVTKNTGRLTVLNRESKYEIEVVANSDTAKYDGDEHSVSGLVSTTFEVEGNTYTVEGLSASASGTDADTYTAAVTGTAVVKDAENNVVTSEFTVKTQSGQLTIDKRQVTLTSADDEQEFNGNPLTNDTVTVTGDGFVSGEGAIYDVTGSQTLVGFSNNSFTYQLQSNTKAGNYQINTAAGTLTVLNRTAKYNITVEANGGEELYDGTEKSVSGFKTLNFTIEGHAYTVSGLTAGTAKTDAGNYPITVTGTAVVKDADNNVVTDQFNVSAEGSALIINKRQVTLTSAGGTKTFNNIALVKNAQTDVTVTGDGFAAGEGAVYDITGSQTFSGSSDNTFTYALNANTKADNYEIERAFGKLIVNKVEGQVVVTITEHSDSKKYDGNTYTVEGYDVVISNPLYTVNDFTFSGNASVSGTDADSYSMNLTADDFTNINDEFTNVVFTIVEGQLTIAKRNVTLTSGSDTREFNGVALINGTVTVTGDGWAQGEGATYAITGRQLIAGSSKNYFTYTLNANTKADNYNIAVVLGDLVVTAGEPDPEPYIPPFEPPITIEDDLPLGLNTTDHFAYVIGYADGTVQPLANITRAEVATIFFRLLDEETRLMNISRENSYSDVSADAWYNTAVSTLSAMEVITGYEDGTFRPNANITRAEFAAVAARFDTVKDTTAADFTDISGHWAFEEICIAANRNWVTGYEDNTFRPNTFINRAEAMTLINRVLNRAPELESDLLDTMVIWIDNKDPKAWYYLAIQEATNGHNYERKTDPDFETWTELLPNRDWSALEG